jgi:hypothetical protein
MILLFAATVWLIAMLIAIPVAATYLWRDLVAIGVIGIATLGFFWRVIFGNAWMPAGGGDLANFLYPTYHFAAEWWRHGIVPLWNPYLFAGQPFLGDIQSGIFYPINLLTFLISFPFSFRDMEYLSILHFFVAGAGMYFFLRFGKWGNSRITPAQANSVSEIQNSQPQAANLGLGISILPALAGARLEFSDLFITHFGNLNLIAVAAWMPLVLLFYRRAVLDRRPAFAVIGGMFLAIAFHAGHIQSFLFIILALVILAIYHAMSLRAPQGRSNPHIPVEFASSLPLLAMTYLVLVALVALGLSAPVLVPAIEFTQHTVRAEFSYEQASQFSLPPAQLIGLFVPGFFGRGPQNAWGPWQRVEVGYIGIMPLVLALLALILRRDSITKFFAVLSLIGLVLALGGYAILHGWLYQFAPGFGQLRAPARFVFLFDFGIAALAALAMDTLMHALSRAAEISFKRFVHVAPWVFLLVALAGGSTAYAIMILGQGQDAVLFQRIANAANALALFIFLFGLSLALILARATRFFRPIPWAVAALALIFLDLFSLGAYVDISTEDPSRVFDHPETVAFLKGNPDFYRIDPRGTGVDNAWTADTAIVHNLFSIDGDNPLALSDFDKYWNGMGSRSSTLYDLLNVKYLIGRKGVPLDTLKFKLAFDGDPSLSVFENTRVLPRAFVVSNARAAADHNSAFEAIHTADFDPLRSVILEGSVPTPTNNRQGDAAVRIVGYNPNTISLETSSASEGILVLSEVYYPGWRAWIDEREVPVLRADYLFRAIELPAGAHRVRFSYDPSSLKIGAGLFAIALVGLVAWGIVSQRRF